MDSEDDREEYYNELDDEGEEGEDVEGDDDEEVEPTDDGEEGVLAAMLDDDEEDGGEYQPTNPLHYIRMIRQILTGYVKEKALKPFLT